MPHDLFDVRHLERAGNVSQLLEMLGSRDPAARSAAAMALGKLKARTAGTALTRAMDDKADGVRLSAIVAAGQVGAPEAVDRLIEFARAGREKGERPQAITALGLIGDERAVPAVIRALDARKLRGWAIEALGRIGGDDAEAAVRSVHVPAWHRWDHLRRRQALSRLAQRTGVGSPLVNVLAELVTRGVVNFLNAGAIIWLAVALIDARLLPSIAVAAAVTLVYSGWRMWRGPGVVAQRTPAAETLPPGAPATERWWRTGARQLGWGLATLTVGLGLFALIDLAAPLEVAAGITAGLFRWPSCAREAFRLARWQRRERGPLLHELIDDETDRYFVVD
jgi:hypothetical protein